MLENRKGEFALDVIMLWNNFTFDSVTKICASITVALCIWFTLKSMNNASRNIVDNGAQHVMTVGVTFTFIGIIIALFNFDVSNIDAIRASISAFLSGMKTAFITSIIGIFFSLFISRFVQAKVERNSKLTLNKQLADIADNAAVIPNLILQLKASMDKSDLSDLKGELASLSGAMTQYVNSSNTFAEQMMSVVDKLNASVVTLEKSIAEQLPRLDAMMEHSKNAESNSSKMLQATVDYQQASLQNKREQLQILNANLRRA